MSTTRRRVDLGQCNGCVKIEFNEKSWNTENNFEHRYRRQSIII
jgi:hypothetical protein